MSSSAGPHRRCTESNRSTDPAAPDVAARRAALRALADKYVEAFPDGYLEELRQDWPD